MNIGERKIFVDISGIPIYTDIEDADMHSAKRYEEVREMEQEFDERFWVCVSRHCVAAYESACEKTPVHLGEICASCQYVHQCYKT